MAIQYSWNKTINHHDVDGSSMVILCFVGKRRRWVSETKISRGSKLEIWIHQSYYLFSYQDYHCLEIFHHFVSNLDYFFSFFQILTSLFVCEDGGQARLEQFNREWFQILATFLSRNADRGEGAAFKICIFVFAFGFVFVFIFWQRFYLETLTWARFAFKIPELLNLKKERQSFFLKYASECCGRF